MTHTTQLCLGTVQFGLPYGITNQSGQVPEVEVRRILDLAAASGISLLDTAQAYGTAETVLGQCWPTDAPRRLISKLPAGALRQSWEDSLITSLQRLHAPKLDGFLLHRASDLLAPDGDALLDWLEGLRERGLVERIGVSIYDASELEGLPLDRLQLVQLPLSLYDQRVLGDGTLTRLRDHGIAVHTRSAFLQGLILQHPKDWPNFLSFAFRQHHARCTADFQLHGLSFLQAAIGFVRQLQDVEAVLIGVLSVEELAQILQAWHYDWPAVSNPTMSSWAWEHKSDLDPRSWPSR